LGALALEALLPAPHERVVQQFDVELVLVHARHFQSHHHAPFVLEHFAAEHRPAVRR